MSFWLQNGRDGRPCELPRRLRLTVERHSAGYTPHVLAASVRRQQMVHFQMSSRPEAHVARRAAGTPQYSTRSRFVVSTSRFGVGQVEGSNCTPLGLHRVAEKIGGGWPVGTAFQSRKVVGFV